MHLNGDEHTCAKHQSDNFSLLSTASRVAARNRYIVFPPVHPGGGVDYGSEDRPDTASSTTTAVPDSVLRRRSLDSTSENDLGPRSPLSQNSTPSNAALPYIPYELPVPVPIAPAVRPPCGMGEGAGHRPRLQRRSGSTSPYFNPMLLLSIMVIMYACYRYNFREDFQYQDEVIRGHFGLPNG